MLNLQLFINNKDRIIYNNTNINKNNTNCTICLEHLTTYNNIELSCHHSYHEDCMIELITYGFRYRACKRTKCIEYKCPLCRKRITYEEIRNIIINHYKIIKLEYRDIKQILKKKRNELFIKNIKFQLKGLIRKHKQNDIFRHLEISEEIISEKNDLTFQLINKKKYIQKIYRMLIKFL